MGLTKANFKSVSRKSITIVSSWDDGESSDLKIAELLLIYHLPGTFYIVLDKVGKEGYLTWEEIKRLDSQGFKIGSHTMTHPEDLKLLFDDDLFVEIQTSKDLLEAALGHHVESFCYPRGRVDERVKSKVIEAGYLEARKTGKPGITKIDDPFYLPGTLQIFQRPEYGEKSILEFAKETLDKVKKEGGYCNIWGHSEEINRDNNWKVLEEILAYASEITFNRN